MSSTNTICILCGKSDGQVTILSQTDRYKVECPRCGTYMATGTFYEMSSQSLDKLEGQGYLLSGIMRARHDQGLEPLLVNSDFRDTLLPFASPPTGPVEAIDTILQYLQENLVDEGQFNSFNPDNDYPLTFARSAQAFSYQLSQAMSLGYPEKHIQVSSYRLTISGWQRLDLLKHLGQSSKQAFVAMWFDDELMQVYEEGFKSALEATGYNPVVMFQVEHSGKICDRIISEIRKSGLLVADFTGNRGGVYFEAGFAKGLGIQVIWTCKNEKKHIKGLHFDTRQYNHIFWNDANDLKEQLLRRIEAEVALPNSI